MVSTSRLLKVISAVLIAVLALGACSARPGTAAVVEGRTISENDLSLASSELSEVLGQPVNSQAVLQILIVAPTMIQVASRHGVSVSADDAQDFLAGEAASSGQQVAEGGYGTDTVTVGRYLLLDSALRSSNEGGAIGADLQEEFADLDVELSPRYGEWTPEAGPTPVQPEWILGTVEGEAA